MIRLVIILLLIGNAFAKAQSIQDIIPKIEELPRQITDTLNRDYDDRSLIVPNIDQSIQDNYNTNEFYYYDTISDGDNFVSQFFDMFFGWIADTFGVQISPYWGRILKIIIYILIGAIGVYIIIKLLSNESPSSLLARSNMPTASVSIADTDIQEIDLDQFINDSIAAGNYRNAIRYLYLDTLKWLSARDIIDWDYQKTNTDYYYEIKDDTVKSKFKQLSYLYDYVWYGSFTVDQHSFDEAKLQFKQFKNSAT